MTAPHTGNDARWWQILLGLVAIVAGLLLTLLLARTTVRTFQSLDSEVAVAVVTAFAAVVVAVAGAVLNRRFERRSVAERAQQEKRIPVYETFAKDLLNAMGATKHPSERQPMDEKEVVRLIGRFTEEILVWGSDEVVKTWVNFRYANWEASAESEAAAENLFRLEELFLALRRDLGLPNKKLAKGDLLRLFVNDLRTDGRSPSTT